MRFLLLPLFIFLSLSVNSQCRTYKLASNGDTLNCTDMNNLKQGKWVQSFPKLRGEPGYEEEGVYKNGKKEGMWRTFNLMGDLLAQENYKWGNKHGRCFYFTLMGLEHEESWRAVNPNKAYDTIDVQDLINPNKYEKVIVKTDGNSLKHGLWKYYVAGTGKLIETQEYFMDRLKTADEDLAALGDTIQVKQASKKDSIATVKPKTKETIEFDKKNPKKTKPKTGRTIQNN
ncbi:MAG: hypothetical protein Q8K64_12030 [Sediminibacterium sp.]|nr:hypothetical protein [Sediminibacterium sp.]